VPPTPPSPTSFLHPFCQPITPSPIIFFSPSPTSHPPKLFIRAANKRNQKLNFFSQKKKKTPSFLKLRDYHHVNSIQEIHITFHAQNMMTKHRFFLNSKI
jgi:hypothetical protein